MKLYRLLVSFGASLLLTFGSGYLCTLLIETQSEWYLGLRKPVFMPNGVFISCVWPIAFALFIVAITFSVLRPEIRKTLIGWGVVLILNPLWCLLFFKFNLALVSLTFILLMIVSLLVITNIYIKKTKELWLSMIPLLSWYIFLFILNYAIVMMN